ncbi:unnamed protein product [Cyclocybe aegerita]|uniref:DNA repair protein RAD50 n=1 Tax=Cyclocybe aegerita TaxID=1973307 RepID=A0A8S0XGC7_CYCAE|nr:unnamed protein product [Cyclocybe aegerita]
MAALNKLAIRGIRSFDDKQISVIEFFSPVTVIVGHNGSGKTTIIECLKYATTGDQPPNTRGGAFVHDPKMANEKEVKAQVKLRFHAANGARMLVVRNLSVTVKKTAGLTMKTLESILALADGNADKGGKRGVISTKCAEMDTEIPQLLGVSKAVLENVIFCHQEDSYWPLAEPAALKKKFDDIFEATRYTKALDSIKTLRKDRMAELKAEKETLVSLSREKAHCDKLKDRISSLKSTIGAKEVECEESKRQYDAQVEANRKFDELYAKFREMYLNVEKLEESKKLTQSTLREVQMKCELVPGTLEELESRQNQFQDIINSQKEKGELERRKLEDIQEEIDSLQVQQKRLWNEEGRLRGEAEDQKRRISSREQAIHEIGDTFGIKGFNYSPLERDKVIEFLTRLDDVQQRRRSELEKLQSELKSENEVYQNKLRVLDKELERQNLQKQNIRSQIAERQQKIHSAERQLEDLEDVPVSLRNTRAEMEEKKDRLQKLKSSIAAARYDTRLADFAKKARGLEERRDELNIELQSLTSQAEYRARLDLKRGEVKNKTSEVENNMDLINNKLKSFIGHEVNISTVEEDAEHLYLEKDRERAKIENESRAANGKLQKADLDLSHLNNQLKQKKAELKKLDAQLEGEWEKDTTLDKHIEATAVEVDLRKTHIATSSVYASMLKETKKTKVCSACTRSLTNTELAVFEKHIQKTIEKASEENIDVLMEELPDWESELDRLQKLRPISAARDALTAKEIPQLEEEIKRKEAVHPEIGLEVEQIGERLEAINRQVKDILTVKQQAITTVLRLQKEIDKARQEVDQLETSLATTGSTKTADEVQNELNAIREELRKNDRESKSLSSEAERQSNLSHELEKSLHQMEKEELGLLNKLRDKERLEEEAAKMKQEIMDLSAQSKDVEANLARAREPREALQTRFEQVQRDLTSRVNQAQQVSEDLNRSIDKLNDMNKAIERYVKDKKARALDDCSSKLKECDEQLSNLQSQTESCRQVIASIDKEINESGATLSNLRDNIIVQKLTMEISKIQSEINSYDMDEAAKARRNYEHKYRPAKEREEKLNEVYHQLTGELGSLKAQLKTLESDLKEFKDVYKKYTDQLIRVKVSDMANNDLEKYAKALDNAIMKYHGLKMEEVNDTMKHLWNKTYQGTDIDGIKIASDVEGGASKRSYNYRVVMTKDQVEMDMRGRCSAGQKMLASIIIRLALSDSFGQNCGILALDEPTNALDTENIDALAASLVDIINERKTHSNFQLVIITHDENFLRKLGQADVMEYYWRVSRDTRQKSVIERQRFR